MIRYSLVLSTRSPLVIAARHSAIGGATPSLDYVPGGVLRGALAGALLRQGMKETAPEFQTLFVEGLVNYGNLYPTTPGAEVAWPLPLTAWGCKLQPGFRPAPDAVRTPEDGHGMVDSLLAQLGEAEGIQAIESCPISDCRAQREADDGYFVEKRVGVYHKPEHVRRLITRTAMAGQWGTAQPGSLYTVEAIEEDQYFMGYLQVDEQAAAVLEATLRQPGLRDELYLGLGRSRGLGHVRIASFNRTLATDHHLGLATAVEERWRRPEWIAHLPGLAAERFAFVVTLYADAILLDDYGRYQTGLNDGAWERILRYAGQPDAGIAGWPQSIRTVWQATATRNVQGWRFAPGWRKRSPEEMAVLRGSVFVCTAERQEEQAVLALLRRLETTGIGRRRSEGFGQLAVGHPWHEEGIR